VTDYIVLIGMLTTIRGHIAPTVLIGLGLTQVHRISGLRSLPEIMIVVCKVVPGHQTQRWSPDRRPASGRRMGRGRLHCEFWPYVY